MVVGREVELDRLLRAVHELRAGTGPSCFFLIGEGGVGKTRLLAEVVAESRQLDLAVLTGRSPVTTPVAFSVVADALRSWLRAHPIEAGLPPYDAGLRLVVPEWPSGRGSTPSLSEAQLRLLALEGVVRVVGQHRLDLLHARGLRHRAVASGQVVRSAYPAPRRNRDPRGFFRSRRSPRLHRAESPARGIDGRRENRRGAQQTERGR